VAKSTSFKALLKLSLQQIKVHIAINREYVAMCRDGSTGLAAANEWHIKVIVNR